MCSPGTQVTTASPIFAFSALPSGSGGEESCSYKPTRTNDLLCDKVQASQVTSSELDYVLPKPISATDSYVSRLMSPLSQLGVDSVGDFEVTKDDFTVSEGFART